MISKAVLANYLVVWCKTLTWWFQVSCLRWVETSKQKPDTGWGSYLPVGSCWMYGRCFQTDMHRVVSTKPCHKIINDGYVRMQETLLLWHAETQNIYKPAEDWPPFEPMTRHVCCLSCYEPFLLLHSEGSRPIGKPLYSAFFSWVCLKMGA